MNTVMLVLGLLVLAESLGLVIFGLALRDVHSTEELTPRVKRLMTVSFIQGWRRAYRGQPRGNWTPELARASLDIDGLNTREEAERCKRVRDRGWLED